MEIIVARNAGFCFGVQNAIEKAEKIASEGKIVYTYGPIIHNKQVVQNLKEKGVDVKGEIEKVEPGDKVIIRSHGVPRREYEELVQKGSEVIDATCPYVKHIHRIVEEKSKAGYRILIIGDPTHPEVKGINGWCNDMGIIINGEEDLASLGAIPGRLCIVAQTTYNEEKWHSLVCKIIRIARETIVINTICNATEQRQRETMELSKSVDAMIVVGGRESSNTRKLFEISMENCPNTIFIETAEELDFKLLDGAESVGITAGASTPDYIINEVVNKFKFVKKLVLEEREEKMQDGNFLDEYSLDFKKIHSGLILEGKVIHVTNKEVYFDIGYKSDGVLPAEEASHGDISLKETFKVGDTLMVEVVQTNDGEGNVLLSRRGIEEEEFVKSLEDVKEQGKVIEVIVKAVNKGGFECRYNNVKAFMPLSLSGVGRDEDNEAYVGKKLKVQIADIKEKRGGVEVTVSRRELMKLEREDRRKTALETLDYNQTVKGSVKSIIDVGAFVNIGDIDVFVPVSEMSWRRISKPQDVVKEGDKIEVLLIKIDKEQQRVTGSLKRMKKEPWEDFVENHREEEIVEGKVVRFTDFGAFVELQEGVDGLIHISNLSDKRVNKPQDVVKAGEMVKVKIIKIDTEARKVSLSLKDAQEQAE